MPARTPADLQRLLTAHAADIDAILRTHTDDEMDRDDLRQEIAIAVWKAMPRFLGLSSERTYVLRIAHNRAVSFRLRLARNRALFRPLEVDAAADARESAEHDIERLSAALRSAMTRLPAPQHQLLALAAAGLSPGQIATRTGRSAGAVRVALHRARQAVRHLVGADR